MRCRSREQQMVAALTRKHGGARIPHSRVANSSGADHSSRDYQFVDQVVVIPTRGSTCEYHTWLLLTRYRSREYQVVPVLTQYESRE